MRAVVCLAGGMGAGKSTLARKLAERFPGSIVRTFGDVVRQRAAEEGRSRDRESLQEVGLRLIAEGWERFVGRLLEGLEPEKGGLLIIEGIRHVEAVEEIRRRFPRTPVRTVFLQLDLTTRDARLMERDGAAGDGEHEVEAEVGRVEQVADLSVDASRPVDETAAHVSRLVS